MALNHTKKQTLYPLYANEEATDSSGIIRFESIPTPEKLKRKSLFGIPLKSQLTGENILDETLQDYINEAMSSIEHALDIYIKPVVISETHDYDKHIWSQSFAYIKLCHPNVLEVHQVSLRFINSNKASNVPGLVSENPHDDNAMNTESDLEGTWIDIPREYVYLRPQEGQIQLVPAYGTTIGGFLLSTFSGAQFWALNRWDITNFPGAVRVKYKCGFDEDKIPAIIAQLIEITAAIDILSSLGHLLFPYQSSSISIDGLSQGVGMPGPQFLANRINDLKLKRDELMETAKGYYQRKFQISYF